VEQAEKPALLKNMMNLISQELVNPQSEIDNPQSQGIASLRSQ